MIRAAIIGCGKIADSHAAQMRQIEGCDIVGACDKEELMAKQLCERFRISRSFKSTEDLLKEARPNVVHITTPPQSHFAIAKQCLEHGCHIYVEKPFVLRVAEAEELTDLACRKGLKLTVGHDAQFSHVACRMRELVGHGYLGGAPVHMESYWCYDLGEASYAKTLLRDRQHWIRTLPGGLLRNIIGHGLARIAEFTRGAEIRVVAHGFVSPFLQSLGEYEIVDELRVLVSNELRTTAYFTFSSQMRPTLHQFRVYGSQNGLILDEDQQTLIKLRGARMKSYAERFLPPLGLAQQYASNVFRNLRHFLHRDFHFDAGKKKLMESFYLAVEDRGPIPIPYREILMCYRLMDMILEQIGTHRSFPIAF